MAEGSNPACPSEQLHRRICDEASAFCVDYHGDEEPYLCFAYLGIYLLHFISVLSRYIGKAHLSALKIL